MLVESKEIKAMLQGLIKERIKRMDSAKDVQEQNHHETICEAYEHVLKRIEHMEASDHDRQQDEAYLKELESQI